MAKEYAFSRIVALHIVLSIANSMPTTTETFPSNPMEEWRNHKELFELRPFKPTKDESSEDPCELKAVKELLDLYLKINHISGDDASEANAIKNAEEDVVDDKHHKRTKRSLYDRSVHPKKLNEWGPAKNNLFSALKDYYYVDPELLNGDYNDDDIDDDEVTYNRYPMKINRNGYGGVNSPADNFYIKQNAQKNLHGAKPPASIPLNRTAVHFRSGKKSKSSRSSKSLITTVKKIVNGFRELPGKCLGPLMDILSELKASKIVSAIWKLFGGGGGDEEEKGKKKKGKKGKKKKGKNSTEEEEDEEGDD